MARFRSDDILMQVELASLAGEAAHAIAPRAFVGAYQGGFYAEPAAPAAKTPRDELAAAWAGVPFVAEPMFTALSPALAAAAREAARVLVSVSMAPSTPSSLTLSRELEGLARHLEGTALREAADVRALLAPPLGVDPAGENARRGRGTDTATDGAPAPATVASRRALAAFRVSPPPPSADSDDSLDGDDAIWRDLVSMQPDEHARRDAQQLVDLMRGALRSPRLIDDGEAVCLCGTADDGAWVGVRVRR
jgi:hypothetical protein